MLYPTTVDVLAVHDKSTRCDPPDKEITAGEFVALLVIVTLPVALPVVVGVNVTVIGTDSPAVSTWPALTPVALKPVPDTVI